MFRTAYAARAIGALLSFATSFNEPVTVVSHRAKAYPFKRPSILFQPHLSSNEGYMVELPGTAPGSDPCITSAFMTIVPRDSLLLVLFLKNWKGVITIQMYFEMH